MLQLVATLASLLLASMALAVIAASLFDDWGAFRRALFLGSPSLAPRLPARTRQLAPARRARIVRISPEAAPRRAA